MYLFRPLFYFPTFEIKYPSLPCQRVPEIPTSFIHSVSTMVWMFVSHRNSYVGILTPNAMALGGEAFRNGIGALMKATLWSSLPLSSMCRYKEKLAAWKRALPWPCWCPDLGLPASGIVRDSCVFTSSPDGSILLCWSPSGPGILHLPKAPTGLFPEIPFFTCFLEDT